MRTGVFRGWTWHRLEVSEYPGMTIFVGVRRMTVYRKQIKFYPESNVIDIINRCSRAQNTITSASTKLIC